MRNIYNHHHSKLLHGPLTSSEEVLALQQVQDQVQKYPVRVIPYTIYTIQFFERQNIPERANKYRVLAKERDIYSGSGDFMVAGDVIVKKSTEKLLVQGVDDNRLYVVTLTYLLMDDAKGWSTLTVAFGMESVELEEDEKHEWQYLDDKPLLSYYLHKRFSEIRRNMLAW